MTCVDGYRRLAADLTDKGNAVRSTWLLNLVLIGVASSALLGAAPGLAQAATAQPVQTLDRVDVYNKSNVLEMEFDNPARTFDFATLAISPASTTGFRACQVTASQALYCIDGKEVRYWAKPLEAVGPGQLLFTCSALGLDANRFDTCIGLTVDLSGTIWLSGRNTAGTYSLFRLTPASGSCGAQVTAGTYCGSEIARDPRKFLDLSAIDGDAGAAFIGPNNVRGPGILALEATSDVNEVTSNSLMFFPAGAAGGAPVTIASGTLNWGGLALQPGERLQSATLLQLPAALGTVSNFALVATTASRVLAIDTANPVAARAVFDINASRQGVPQTSSPVKCNLLTFQQYGIRASSKSGRVYLTDRIYCQAVALQSNGGNPFALVNVQENGKNLTFSTTASYPPDAATIAPGVIVNLVDCSATCVLLTDALGNRAASLSGVQLAGSKSGMTLFQVKNIPDCRWDASLCTGLGFLPTDATLVFDGAGNGVPLNDSRIGSAAANQLFLNVTPLLPREITGQFVANAAPPRGLPRMLISPQYRAQQQNLFKFEALFGIPEAGVIFKQTFTGEFDVCRLTGGTTEYNANGTWKGCKLPGKELGCGYDYSEGKKPNRDWDVTTTVSEKYVTAVPGAANVASSVLKYVDTLTNTGCYNPTRISGDRWSMYAYNLEIAPNTDAVFARLLSSLYSDLEETRAELTCKQVDTTATSVAPVSRQACANLKKLWDSGKTKLDKCVSASTQPKSSAGSENCQSFASQLKLYQDALNSLPVPPASQDPANRLGELKARVAVLFHVYSDRFQPSIPANGFTNL